MSEFTRSELTKIDIWLNGGERPRRKKHDYGTADLNARKKANRERRAAVRRVLEWQQRNPKKWAEYMRWYRKWKKTRNQALHKAG